MGIATFPAAGGGGIKSVQRGQAVSSGNITITSVDTTKTFVRSFSEGASGTVQTNSTIAAHNVSNPSHTISNPAYGSGPAGDNGSATMTLSASQGTNTSHFWTTRWAMYFPATTSTAAANTSTAAAAAASGGSTSLTSANFGVYLSNSTTLVATGACRYEVVEFN